MHATLTPGTSLSRCVPADTWSLFVLVAASSQACVKCQVCTWSDDCLAQVAARFSSLDALRTLIELGANVEAKDGRSKTALQVSDMPWCMWCEGWAHQSKT
jgi:hypothetical protein